MTSPDRWTDALISSKKRDKNKFPKVGEKEEDKQHGHRDGTTLNRQKSTQGGWDEWEMKINVIVRWEET